MHIQHTTTLANKTISVSAISYSSDGDHNETMYAFHPQNGTLDAQTDCRSVNYYPPKHCFERQLTETLDCQFECNHEQASTVFQSFVLCKNNREIAASQFPSQVCFVNHSIPSETHSEWEQERSIQEYSPPATHLEIETQVSLDIDSSLKRKRESFLLDFMLADFDPHVLRRKGDTKPTREGDPCVNKECFKDNETSRDGSPNNTSAASRNTQNATFGPTLPCNINKAISSLLEHREEETRMETTTPEASLFHLIDKILVSRVDTEAKNRFIACEECVSHTECKSPKKAAIAVTDTQPIDVEGLLDPITFETLCSNDRYWSGASCADFTTDPDSYNLEAWHDMSDAHNEEPPNKDQDAAELRLDRAMKLSSLTTSSLQEWDRANGLPKSHSQTMVNSSRSREQLQSGMVLQKWNGTPLLRLPGARVKIRRRMFKGEKVAGLSCD